MRVLVGVVLVLCAVGGFVLFIPQQRPSPGRLALLAVSGRSAHLSGRVHNAVADPSSSSLVSVRRAAAATPGETAVYSRRWAAKKAHSSASLTVLVTPSGRLAREVRTSAAASRLAQSSLTAQGYGYVGPLRDAAVPGARAATYVGGTSPTVSATLPHEDVVVFLVDRVVVVATAAGATAAKSQSAVEALASAEYHHLLDVGARPSLAETSVPPLAAVLYLLPGAVVIAGVALSPSPVALARRRRQAAHAEALRRERASRGRKVVKRRGGSVPVGRSHARR